MCLRGLYMNFIVMKVRYFFGVVFCNSADLSTEDGRGQERYRRVAKSSSMALLARIVNIFTNLISIPLTVKYLGADLFGLWMTVTDFVAFLIFADLGLLIGMQNALTACDGKEDKETPKVIVSSTLAVLLLIISFVLIFLFFALPLVPFDQYIKIASPEAKLQLLPTIQVMFAVFSYGLLANLTCRIYDAYQLGYLGNMWMLFGRLAGFVGVIICVIFKAPLPVLAACYAGLPFVVLSIGAVGLLKQMPWLKPSLSSVHFGTAKDIFGIGITAFGAQLAYVLMQTGPTLLIANRFGVAAVGLFSVVRKLTGLTSILFTTAVAPLWPAFGEAASRGDWDWVRVTFIKALKWLGVIYVPAFLLIAVMGQWLIDIWTRGEFVSSWNLLMAVNIWAVLMAWNTVVSVLLNGLNHMKGQATYGVALALFSLFLGYWVSTLEIGSLEVVVWVIVLTGVLARSVFMGGEAACVLKKNFKN